MVHIALSKHLDFQQIAADAAADRGPNHVLLELAQAIPVRFHMPAPGGMEASRSDRLHGRIFSRPDLWALAREILAASSAQDTLFATGEDIGVPLAAQARSLPRPPRIVVFAHNVSRPRARMAMRLFRCRQMIRTWLTNAVRQQEFLTRRLGVSAQKVLLIPEQTDTGFFTPGLPGSDVEDAGEPFIFSVGLEKRDYRTLAAATHDLPVRVEISAYSADARMRARIFPPALPKNWCCADRRQSWQELRSLYRRSRIVVIALQDNPFCAGLTAMLEAMACEKPVIVTRTGGLRAYLPRPGSAASEWFGAELPCCPVAAGDAAGLRSAIGLLLDRPEVASQLARAGRTAVLARHRPREWVSTLSGILEPSRRSFDYQVARAIVPGIGARSGLTWARAF